CRTASPRPNWWAATRTTSAWSPPTSASSKRRASASTCRSTCAAPRSRNACGAHCARSRPAARRPTRRSRGASASRARYARSPAPAPPTNSPSPSPATAWCAATAASPATAGAWSASAGCWSARPRSEPEPQAEVDRARLPRLQQCVALPCTVAHRELPDIRLVAQVAQLAEQRPALALDAHPQAEQVVRTDLVGVAEIRVAPADQVERRSRVEAAVVTVHHLAAHHVARCPGQGVVAVVGIAVEREGVPA